MDTLPLFFLTAVPEGRVFGLDAQMLFTIVFQLINASVLAAVLTYLLYKPVRKFLQKRNDKIKSQLDRAEGDMTQATALKAQYEQNLDNIDQERMEILETAHKQAMEKSRNVIQDGRKEADVLRERALQSIQREQEQLQDALKCHIIDISSAMAGKIVAHVIDPQIQDRLFAETLKELEETPWPN
ncbi:MAG: ATP synthase F0 subunit B [Oscillospiraceae bacterium]|nr:ATP synthase F0 subunit B [Oscillospiraceae bacterium]